MTQQPKEKDFPVVCVPAQDAAKLAAMEIAATGAKAPQAPTSPPGPDRCR